jgi:ATP-dependent Clp protease ATP-binding subunit ClpC
MIGDFAMPPLHPEPDYSEALREALRLAHEEAAGMRQSRVDTDHFLIGLIAESRGMASRILANHSVELETARSLSLLIHGEGDWPSAPQDLTSRARTAFEVAVREAVRFHRAVVDTEHLLLGLVETRDGVAYGILRHLKADPEAIREEIITQAAKEESS